MNFVYMYKEHRIKLLVWTNKKNNLVLYLQT